MKVRKTLGQINNRKRLFKNIYLSSFFIGNIANIIDRPKNKRKFGFNPSLNKTNIKDKKIKADPKSGCNKVSIAGIKMIRKT